jgi:hypothetical protein
VRGHNTHSIYSSIYVERERERERWKEYKSLGRIERIKNISIRSNQKKTITTTTTKHSREVVIRSAMDLLGHG